MESLDIFTLSDLRQRPADLVRDVEAGQLALITQRGKPSALAVPFGPRLLECGLQYTLALQLFEGGQLTLAQAAHLAGLTLADFLDLLKVAGLAAVDYPDADVAEEWRRAL